ncbi:MAG: hypothetical protein WDM87_17050 [Terracidiphilus sp.]
MPPKIVKGSKQASATPPSCREPQTYFAQPAFTPRQTLFVDGVALPIEPESHG